MEGFIMPPLPHLAVERIKLSMAPSLHPRYQTSQLLRATPPSCCLRPLSCPPVIGPIFSKDFSVGHTGLLQFPSRPCYRVAANTPPVCFISSASVRYPILSSPHFDWFDHRFLAFTRLAQRLLALQPGNSLISPKLTLSVGFSTSITLHAATQARRLLAFTAAGLPSPRESHPMDHDSVSSGHAKKAKLDPITDPITTTALL